MGHPNAINGSTGLSADPFTPLLDGDGNIRVQATNALPAGFGAPIQATEQTYSLMMSISKSLGVNCTFCHNTREFGQWGESTPQRVTAWHGIQMVQGPQQSLPRSAGGYLSGEAASDRKATDPSSIARPAIRASANRFSA